MQEKYEGQVVGISWNLDHREDDQPPAEELVAAVKSKLQKLKLNCENVISSDSIDAVLEKYGIFGLPAVLVYGSDGTLAKKFEGAFTYEKDINPFVAKLLEGNG